MSRKIVNNWKAQTGQKNHDLVLTRYSKNGVPELEVIFEWKTIGKRREVVGVCIQSVGFKAPVSAGDIRSIPFSVLEIMERQNRPDLISGGKTIEVKSGPQSGKPLTSAELKMVADLYREARNLGVPTARHIAKQMEISESTVGKRISAARKAGLLGSALGTKAGEKPTRIQVKRK